MEQENMSNVEKLIGCADIAYGIMSRTKGLPRVLDLSVSMAVDSIREYDNLRPLVTDSMPADLLKSYDKEVEEARRYFEYLPPQKKLI